MGAETPFGSPLNDQLYAPNHQHFFCVRLDTAVDGDHNSVVETDTVADPMGPSNPHGNAFYGVSTTFKSELEAQRLIDPFKARFWSIVNPNTRNKVGRPTGYKLVAGESYVVTAKLDKIEAVTALDLDARIFLYAARDSDMLALSQWERAQAVLEDYDNLFTRSRSLQLQFNIALFFVSLLIVGLALWIALVVADRMVRPVNELVHAAKRITEGDLATRISAPITTDEIGTLGRAFNRMTERLETQTSALIAANEQLGNRREFIETVLESVTAGIISLSETGEIRLINSHAQALLAKEDENLLDRKISDIAPEFDQLVIDQVQNTIIQFSSGNELRTLEVNIAASHTGHVITFEDITQQLIDQRRAAWSDVARRIAHEIKNPLTTIQLAAERLQRRFGKKIADDETIFAQLTGTIVRQVGDLRNIVDEFSSFARMPKTVFRP
jgi:two-component system nitrogen regulation sensor histidine kinase NtrY